MNNGVAIAAILIVMVFAGVMVGGGGLTFSDLATDDVDNALITIELPHHEVHEGNHYTTTDSATINAGALNRKVWRFTTPNNTTQCHLILTFTSSLSGVLSFNANPTVNAPGSGLSEYNNNQNSVKTAQLTAFKDTTLTADGTPISILIIGTSAPATRIGGVGRISTEWILKMNEDYVLIFTADNANTLISVVAEWYEV
jgi:hypothetical protein